MTRRRHWFEDVADHLGEAYLRYSFTYGTAQEVEFLVDALALQPGDRVLDVGCGPGRHSIAFAERGLEVVGVDISERFVDLATQAAAGAGVAGRATFRVADARSLDLSAEFDAVVSLCQGAFGLPADPAADVRALEPDAEVLGSMARALRPGGRLALSAFSAYFQVRYLGEDDRFDAERGVNHERTVVRSPEGAEMPTDLWTSCWTPRELRLLARSAGLEVEHVWSVAPGDYRRRPCDLDHPELLLVARRPPPVG